VAVVLHIKILLDLVAQVAVALEMSTQEAPLLRPLERLIQVEAVVVAAIRALEMEATAVQA
jgi:hypothetical protein